MLRRLKKACQKCFKYSWHFIHRASTAKKGLWSASAGWLWSPKRISNYHGPKTTALNPLSVSEIIDGALQDGIQWGESARREMPGFWHIKWSASDVWCRFVPEPGESAVRRSEIWPWRLERRGWTEGQYDRGFIHETDCELSRPVPGTHGRRREWGILERKRRGGKVF